MKKNKPLIPRSKLIKIFSCTQSHLNYLLSKRKIKVVKKDMFIKYYNYEEIRLLYIEWLKKTDRSGCYGGYDRLKFDTNIYLYEISKMGSGHQQALELYFQWGCVNAVAVIYEIPYDFLQNIVYNIIKEIENNITKYINDNYFELNKVISNNYKIDYT